ncbi:PIN domain nuclease, a component of toxin-antitoxin system (PIN domain) [Haloechinothrix alba]|uniref:PIN domain nuclease, a component of toxin-antitoxin system (PIN domain) n=1 Tax=Haloechinothrix alba TaxID=664784 RepID=A0A238XA35_9PSEU|nr:type II toxin-antitoxin system VapC family toxin [Haloechinothrix alba]SNR55204.1 PIN domain nuclease, a component of toxin-antitoxin system (PIN domain) [Haloechinothrix alba]
MTAVLDASAVLALIYREPGHDTVADHLGNAVISAVNYSEVLTKLIAFDHPSPRAAVDGLCDLGVDVHPFTTNAAATAAGLWPTTRSAGLSLGDRACLATAADVPDGVALTADQAWGKLALDVHVQLIR